MVNAAMMIEAGHADVVVAGGCESMSNVEHYTTALRGGAKMGNVELWDRLTRGRLMSQPIERFGVITGMIETAENLAKDYGITREEADAFAVRSHRNAAAACLVVAEDKLEELGLEPALWFTGYAAAGCDPSRMGIGPVPAVELLFARTGMGWDDIGLVELNEAFAPQVLAVLKGWGWSDDDTRREILNVNGSGISLGHPIGATGGRILADMAHEMHRREVRYGLETMCIGGGQGIAALFERAV